MARLLYRLGRWSYRKKWIVIICWVIMLAGMSGAAGVLQKGFTDDYNIPGTGAQQAADLLVSQFPEQKNPIDTAGVTIVFAAPPGHTLAEPEYMAAMDQCIEDLKQLPLTGLMRFGNPVTKSPELQQYVINTAVESGLPEETAREDAAVLGMLSEDGRVGYTSFEIDVPMTIDITDEHREIITNAINKARESGLQVEAGGSGYSGPVVIKTSSEMIGLAVAFLVLIFTFGSVVAAGMPLITALVGVGLGSSAILIGTHFAKVTDVTPVLAVMLGLAVGIDYALFILSRFRTEYQRSPRDEAAGMAVGTAGSAVVFAGLTVVIALAALSLVGIPFLTWMGFAASFTVAMSVLVALTLVPALIGVFGKYVFGVRIPWVDNAKKSGRRSKGLTWGKFVHRHPAGVLVAVVLGLAALSLPAMELHLALPSDSYSDPKSTQRKSADLLAESFGPGINAPFLVVVDAHGVNPDSSVLEPLVAAQNPQTPEEKKAAAEAASYMYISQVFSTHPDVRHVQIIGTNADGAAAQLLLTPRSGPGEPTTAKLLGYLHDQQAEVEQATGVRIGITGLTPIQEDVTEKLSSAMPIYLGVVVGLAVVLLLMVFRSVMVPIVAGVGFLLSMGATFGATVLVWQKGLWGLVDAPGPIISFMPIFLIGVTFGLAMDYQVFLVSRMREYYTHSGGVAESGSRYNAVEESVIQGFAQSSRVVTSAALIMIAVFVAFIDQPLPFVQIFGFALAFGVFVDAFFVRMGLVPAAMFLLGRATWWMPAWLDRLIPRVDIEGESLDREAAAIRAARESAAEHDLKRLVNP